MLMGMGIPIARKWARVSRKLFTALGIAFDVQLAG